MDRMQGQEKQFSAICLTLGFKEWEEVLTMYSPGSLSILIISINNLYKWPL